MDAVVTTVVVLGPDPGRARPGPEVPVLATLEPLVSVVARGWAELAP